MCAGWVLHHAGRGALHTGVPQPEFEGLAALLGGALRNFQFYYQNYSFFWPVYGIWEDLGAWKIVLRDMPMICLPKIEKCQHFFQQLDFAPNSIKDLICQPKLRPADERLGMHTNIWKLDASREVPGLYLTASIFSEP